MTRKFSSGTTTDTTCFANDPHDYYKALSMSEEEAAWSLMNEMKYPLLTRSSDSERRCLMIKDPEACDVSCSAVTTTSLSSSKQVSPLNLSGRSHQPSHSTKKKWPKNIFTFTLFTSVLALVLAITSLWRFIPHRNFPNDHSTNTGTIDLLESGIYNSGRRKKGVSNWYGSDATLCPSGQRHQPKYGHLTALNQMLAGIAPTLLAAMTALGNLKPIECLSNNGKWYICMD
jgi:hypothetical protein